MALQHAQLAQLGCEDHQAARVVYIHPSENGFYPGNTQLPEDSLVRAHKPLN